MVADQGEHTGRRGLFTVTKEENEEKVDNSNIEIESIVSTIIGYETGDFPNVPGSFIPILERLQKDAELLKAKENLALEISKEFDVLKDEHAEVKKEHETYLSDLISAHTEFDRALEIFQYHTVPMVLTSADQKIMDANDVFCSIFSVERSEITRQIPLLSTYIPDQTPFFAPDEVQYSIISITPPIVPFDHEAKTLSFLIPLEKQKDSKRRTQISYSTYEKALTEILLPVAIVDEYNTIQFINDTFLQYLSRERRDVHLRDITSCGFDLEITDNLEEVKNSETRQEYQRMVTHRDNVTIPVWVQLIPIIHDDDKKILIILLPDEEEPAPSALPEEEKSLALFDTCLKTLIDLNPSPIVLFDESYRVILVNEGLSELIGVSADQLYNHTLSDIGLKIPEKILDNEEIEVLSDNVCIESPYGIQCYSGLLISNKTEGCNHHILILQPPLDSEPVNIPNNEPELVDVKPLVSEELEDARKPVSHSGLDFFGSPVPFIEIEGTNITKMNDAFTTWSSVSFENIHEYSAVLISHIVQSDNNPGLILSSVLPAGLKTYRILKQECNEDKVHRICWFVDQTDAYEVINQLRKQIENTSSELSALKNNDSEEQTTLKRPDDLSDQIDIVEFELSGGRYAMDIGMVREVVEMLPITPLPKTPPYIIGIINLRGEVTHVVDLGILLGEGVKKDRTGQKIIIVPPDAAHGEHLGIIVDNVRSVTEIGFRQVTSLGDEINTRIQTNIKGIIKVTQDDLIDRREGEEKESNLVIWLDMKEILNRLAGFH